MLGVLAFTVTVWAQTESASVSGRVTDPSGSVLPNAELQLQSVDRGTAEQALTNDSGLYVFQSIHPGQYRLIVRKVGFRQVDYVGLVVNVQDHIEANFKLVVGSISESVTVTGAAPLVNTESASVSTIINRQFAENLPLNGRSFQTLIELSPGVVVTPSTADAGGQFSVNGQRPSSNYWMVDGVSANIGMSSGPTVGNGASGSLFGFSAQGGTNSLVSVDALEEFRIQTSSYSPEFGRTPGGQISILTRSGTNRLHGTLFDYLRNDVFDANDWFANHNQLPKPQERQNDFGGTLGGHIIKDRTFFFVSYEGLRLRLPQVSETFVPSLNSRQNAISSARPLLDAYPLPNPGAADSNGLSAFNASYSNSSALDAASLRLDHRINEKLTVFSRYDYSPSNSAQRGAGALSQIDRPEITIQTATAGAVWLPLHILTNDLRFNYSKTQAESSSTIDTFGGAVPLKASEIQFPGSFTFANANFTTTIFALSNNSGVTEGVNATNRQEQFNVVDSLSLQKGTHGLKFGVDYRRLSPVYGAFPYGQQVSFNDMPSAEAGNVGFAFVQTTHGANLLFRNLGLFAQDTWRITPRFTATYGLRWDFDFAPTSTQGPNLAAVINFDDPSILTLAPPGTAPFRTTYGNIAPRIGLAYQARQTPGLETVIRGGVGIFFDLATQEVGNLLQTGTYPFGNSSFGFDTTFPLPLAVSVPPPVSASQVGQASMFALDPNLKLPYTAEWSLTLEQSLGSKQALSAAYVASVGRRLIQSQSITNPNPNIANPVLVSNTASSDYQSMQLQFHRQVSKGLQSLVSYTLAHSIDDGSASSQGFSGRSNNFSPTLGSKANRGPSAFDIRHALSAAATYDIPTPRTIALARTILGSWSLQNVVQARSAPPVDVFYAGFFFPTAAASVRPDKVPGVPSYLFGSQFPGGKALNPAAFSSPPIDPVSGFFPLRQGNQGRNGLRAFGAAQWDIAIHREFALHESFKLQFRAELFNLLNHPNFGPPQGNLGPGNPLFGLSTQMLGQSLGGQNLGGGGFNPLYQIGTPRSIQLALKLIF
jgi:hypothetical protein